jgi:hypothetical protein
MKERIEKVEVEKKKIKPFPMVEKMKYPNTTYL